MEKTIFTTFDEYVDIVKELKEKTGLDLFLSLSYEDPYRIIQGIELDDRELINSSLQLNILIGDKEKHSLVDKVQAKVYRSDKIGFVTITYGRDDEAAIGATIFNGDKSEIERKVDRTLTRILKKYANQGVKSAEGGVGGLWDKYYWTNGALTSGKNWHLFLGFGVRKPKNSNIGYTPKQL